MISQSYPAGNSSNIDLIVGKCVCSEHVLVYVLSTLSNIYHLALDTSTSDEKGATPFDYM